MQERAFSVENDRGDTVHGDVRFVEDGSVKPVVVFCHGFKGFKDWGPFPEWGRFLARSGFVAVHFNFSRNGVTPEAPTEFTDLDAFARIDPCGYRGLGVTRTLDEGIEADQETLAGALTQALATRLAYTTVRAEPAAPEQP